ncbi:MAG: complex I subunit 1 family protein [Candidatus Omnitrophota bacterium]|nr:NADH-quinone oxidoreductase subunit H [Candidatus Omnitrophota bacterium]MBU2527829.1 NADH-quinone oxidoreductase subunit H [bacterium]MBU3930744.1 NADH-quinone oxidoreductase subunit H [bacterium]MBU4122900.1 NADH-quinone oxidoreductase subunit H [bacterium]
MITLFHYLIFPGLLFALIIGMIASWIERKVTARVQWRVGPPFLQPLYDIMKLFIKENIVPEHAHYLTFAAAPIISFVSAGLAATIIGMSIFFPSSSFQGDLIVVAYLLVIPALSLILGAAASANPLASLGASREMKMVLSYELIFWIALIVAWIKTGGQLNLSLFAVKGAVGASVSGAIAFALMLITMQAKLGRVPFDAAEAETEISGGTYIEYSGPLLGFFKMSQYIMLVAVPALVSIIFLGGASIGKYVILLVIIILAENTNPRLKITQCLRLFWFFLLPAGLIAIILATLGY